MKLGYACINKGLSEQSIKNVSQPIAHSARLPLKRKVCPMRLLYSHRTVEICLRFSNGMNNTTSSSFRLSSQIVSWATEYQLTDLPDYERLKRFSLSVVYSLRNMVCVTSHPTTLSSLPLPMRMLFATPSETWRFMARFLTYCAYLVPTMPSSTYMSVRPTEISLRLLTTSVVM